MRIYKENSDEMVFGEPATPAHYYTGISDFATILDDMQSGDIPTNTGHVFNVIWKSDMSSNQQTPPWETNNQFGVPIIGDPSIFNL